MMSTKTVAWVISGMAIISMLIALYWMYVSATGMIGAWI